MKNILTLLCAIACLFANAQTIITPFEKDDNYSATYQEAVMHYQNLASQHKAFSFEPVGLTDAGEPFNLGVLSTDGDFNIESLKRKNKLIVFINNGIHAGEPCGVDATMMLVRDYLTNRKLRKKLKNIVLVVVPFYNVGGALNRGSFSRANQEGPHEHGFRGNAKNLDLNRDFIKCDSKNARTFNQQFAAWQPDIFIDNHTSNGADYQYTLTLIAAQKDKLNATLSTYMQQDMLPALYSKMSKTKYEMTPYVYARKTPDDGIFAFLDLPRYSSGYAALHNTIGFMPETHMLKPFRDRVWSVHTFMNTMIDVLCEQGGSLQKARLKTNEQVAKQEAFDVNWQLDMSKEEQLTFKGYAAKYKPSEISGIDRLYYDRNEPWTKEIPFWNSYKASLTIEKPKAYIIPQAYTEVLDRLRWNGVKMTALSEAQAFEVEQYYIEKYEDRAAYEGHYLHNKVEVRKERTLEPQAPDSFFAWNFFDGILMQKEHFSGYVFEDLALDILAHNPELKAQLKAKQAADEEFAKSARAQLDFIYKNSAHYEKTHNRYPVVRVL